jgi:mediator of RNA polymerase II transcription subunit 31
MEQQERWNEGCRRFDSRRSQRILNWTSVYVRVDNSESSVNVRHPLVVSAVYFHMVTSSTKVNVTLSPFCILQTIILYAAREKPLAPKMLCVVRPQQATSATESSVHWRTYQRRMDPSSSMATDKTEPPPPTNSSSEDLPENRFALELEFVEALASPAYLHFLANLRRQQDSWQDHWQPFLRYLYQTYSQPEYARFLRYPHALFFLRSLLEDSSDTNRLWTEWTQPGFRNFCHQQQFLAWQYRHANCYGVGGGDPLAAETETTNGDAAD